MSEDNDCPKSAILALAAGFIAVGAALSGAAWESYRTSQREAWIFASLSADAFKQGFCDRALRLAVAGLPPVEGAFALSFRSPVLQGELSSFASMQDCYFQLALAGHTGLVNSAAFSPDGSRIVTASLGRDRARLGRHDRRGADQARRPQGLGA